MIKYTYKNIRNFIKYDTLVFFLGILVVALSSFMINFSYAVYHNFQIKKESATDEQDYVQITPNYQFEKIYSDEYVGGQYKYEDYHGETVTVEMIRKFGELLGGDIRDDIRAVYACANYYNYEFIFVFSFDEDGFTISKEYLENSQGFVKSGRFFSEEEYKNGNKVALVYDYENINRGQNPISREMIYSDTHIKIGNELYEIIGCHDSLLDIPLIPISSLPDETQMGKAIQIDFYSNVDYYTYNKICEAATIAFGDLVTVEPVKLPDLDVIRLYNTIIIITVIIALVAAINFAILYRYILKKRKKQISYMRLCGMRYSMTIMIFLGEGLWITAPTYILTTLIFINKILPIMSDIYQYGFRDINILVYVVLFGIYFLTSIFILFLMLVTNIKRKQIICGG